MNGTGGGGTAWVDHAIWWHVFPLGFLGAPAEGDPGGAVVHRLPRLAGWLDYLLSLGCNGLLLGPVFASSTHGYDTVDHLRVDPRLGDEADLVALAEAAHAKGVRVALDGVFNHVGRGHLAFADVLARGPASDYAGWFRLRWPDGGSGSSAAPPAEPPAWDGAEPDYDCFEGHRALVALDHASPAVRDHVAEVLRYWGERGVDAWRLDAAYAVPGDFWADVLPRARAARPGTWFLGEVIHGDYPAFVRASTVDSVTQYELWKATWSACNDANLFELAWALERHDALLEAFVPTTFVGNHDVTRIASRMDDPRHVAHAVVVLATVAGVPCVYYGDEQGYAGVKEERVGGDDQVRPVFPDRPGDFSALGRPVLEVYQQLLGLRRRHPWLVRARTEALVVENETLVYASGAEDGAPGDGAPGGSGGGRLVVVLHLGDAPRRVAVPGAADLAVLAGPGARVEATRTGTAVEVPAHGWAVLG